VPDLAEVKKLMEEARAAGALLAITEKDGVKFPPELREKCFILRRRVRLSPEVLQLFERLQSKPRAVN
jgi:tetraacyldisaccharide-1-P 4'-kinase